MLTYFGICYMDDKTKRGTAGRRFKKTSMAHHRKNTNEWTDDMRRRNEGLEASGPSFFSAAAAILRQTPTDYDTMNVGNLQN